MKKIRTQIRNSAQKRCVVSKGLFPLFQSRIGVHPFLPKILNLGDQQGPGVFLGQGSLTGREPAEGEPGPFEPVRRTERTLLCRKRGTMIGVHRRLLQQMDPLPLYPRKIRGPVGKNVFGVKGDLIISRTVIEISLKGKTQHRTLQKIGKLMNIDAGSDTGMDQSGPIRFRGRRIGLGGKQFIGFYDLSRAGIQKEIKDLGGPCRCCRPGKLDLKTDLIEGGPIVIHFSRMVEEPQVIQLVLAGTETVIALLRLMLDPPTDNPVNTVGSRRDQPGPKKSVQRIDNSLLGITTQVQTHESR